MNQIKRPVAFGSAAALRLKHGGSFLCAPGRPLPLTPALQSEKQPAHKKEGPLRNPPFAFLERKASDHSMIFVTTPEPTVRPPSRIAKRSFSSMAIGVISVHSMSTLSPGITISTPSGSLMLPVTSVVRK